MATQNIRSEPLFKQTISLLNVEVKHVIHVKAKRISVYMVDNWWNQMLYGWHHSDNKEPNTGNIGPISVWRDDWSSTIINIGLTLQQFNLITHTSCFLCGGKIQGSTCSKMPPCYDFKRLSRWQGFQSRDPARDTE